MDHCLFVASAARTVARSLGLNEDLAEAIGLAHDIGHPPFGHQGEHFLQKIIDANPAIKRFIPQFHHEVYGLRVVDKLAKIDREEPGLNLTWEVRDGIVSHCGEDYKTCQLQPVQGNKNLEAIKDKTEAGFPTTLEGCLIRLVDKIIYFGKDIEDAIETGVIKADDVPPDIREELGNTNGQMVGTFLEDIIQNSAGCNHIAISGDRGQLLRRMIDFNIKNIYRSPQAEGYKKQAGQTIELLFDDFCKVLRTTNRFEHPQACRQAFVYKVFQKFVCENMKHIYTDSEPDELIVLDFIAGMTDTYAVRSFQELFVPQATV